jgi:hypothetical protein
MQDVRPKKNVPCELPDVSDEDIQAVFDLFRFYMDELERRRTPEDREKLDRIREALSHDRTPDRERSMER